MCFWSYPCLTLVLSTENTSLFFRRNKFFFIERLKDTRVQISLSGHKEPIFWKYYRSYSLTSILVVWESHDLLISSFFFTALYRTFCFIPRAEINFFQRDIKLQGSSALWNFFLKLQQLVMYCNLKQNFSKMCHQIFSRKVLY